MKIECEICNTEFETNRQKQRYCGKECQSKGKLLRQKELKQHNKTKTKSNIQEQKEFIKSYIQDMQETIKPKNGFEVLNTDNLK